jgi:hypothetical protein
MAAKHMNEAEQQNLISNMLKEEQQRSVGYREQALKLFPHVCARCTREFEGKKLRELTVHHKDHNHDNNPPDGSNWELLCIYCHEHEHTRSIQDSREGLEDNKKTEALSFSPFTALASKLKK